MESEKILKLFKNFIGGKLNVDGLVAVPYDIQPSYRNKERISIYFKMFNPNDVSYFSSLVEGILFDETDEFGEFINKKIDVIFDPDFKNGLYLNKELTSRIQKVFNSVKVISFTIGYKRYKLYIESVGISTAHWDDDSYYILNNVKVLRAEKNGEPCDTKEAVNEYTEIFLPDQENYWETETLYKEIDVILNDYPLLTNTYGHTSSYYDTKFVYKIN
jgi:hypothetical protein